MRERCAWKFINIAVNLDLIWEQSISSVKLPPDPGGIGSWRGSERHTHTHTCDRLRHWIYFALRSADEHDFWSTYRRWCRRRSPARSPSWAQLRRRTASLRQHPRRSPPCRFAASHRPSSFFFFLFASSPVAPILPLSSAPDASLRIKSCGHWDSPPALIWWGNLIAA